MQIISMEEVQSQLPELLNQLRKGEDLIITRDGKPVARLMTEGQNGIPILGSGRGTVLYMAPDFDAPLEEFKEYME